MTLIWRMIRALCCGDDAEHRWLAVVDYLVAENRLLRQQLPGAASVCAEIADSAICCREPIDSWSGALGGTDVRAEACHS
ncbi:MAG: hypothetical protein HN742_35445 [Lentisphaerae bacterium]|nr:hypothetical protein [Lentisphaerota bacterium]MBT4820342.1 hypothetical protein [Lentisphaerota bacterium]MBT5612881.1 hypothetical protein [Lentisphaerota bacterium]MBT7056264.1 hypothetical protein [Lentisphaerota bacterium]MBT7847219.1 hypothetical protein [Lentisphaerota bacterium]